MSFDQSAISNVRQSIYIGELTISWDSTAPQGTVYQVYIDGVLAWTGRATVCHLPIPVGVGNHSIDVGAVGPGQGRTNLGPTLPPTLAANRAKLTWLGGTFLDLAIQDFAIYQSPSSGAAVSFTAPVATVPAYPGGIVTDGAGMGPCGQGGWGHAASSYEWVSLPLSSGSWKFAVAARDKSGNRVASPSIVTVVIDTPPRPPAPNPSGLRLTYTYAAPNATLHWLASPDA